MAKNLSRMEERRGTAKLVMIGIALAVVLGAVLAFGPFFSWQEPASSAGDPNGPRSNQGESSSVAGRTSAPPPGAQTNAGNAETTGRAHDLTSTAQSNAALAPEQREAIRQYFAQRPADQANGPAFSISIGVAVPRQVDLNDIPPELARVLPDYSADQYVRVGDRLVIVEKQTRRIVAILPAA